MTQTIQKYPFIDALRGYAILGVLLVHSSQYIAPVNSALLLLMSSGARGIQLFYVVSALTLCMSWEMRNAQEASPVRNFFWRRFFRVAPMFYIAIVFYVSLHGLSPRYWAPNGVEWWFVPLTALFLHGYHPETITSVVPGGWAIAVEMNFYLVLPLMLFRFKSTKSLVILFCISIVLYVIQKLAIENFFRGLYPESQQYLVSSFTYLNFFGQLPVFVTGMIAYAIFRNKGFIRRFVIFGNLFVLSVLLLLILLPGPSMVRIFSNHIVVGLLFALFTLTLACFPVRFLVNRPITQLGKLSFSMYLTHFAVLELFSRTRVSALFDRGDLPSILHYLCVVTVTAALSYFLYVSIERPGVLLGKRIIDKLEEGGGSGLGVTRAAELK